MKQLIIVEDEGMETVIGEQINLLTKQETNELGMWGQLVQIRRLDNLNIESHCYNWRPATFEDLHKYIIEKRG